MWYLMSFGHVLVAAAAMLEGRADAALASAGAVALYVVIQALEDSNAKH